MVGGVPSEKLTEQTRKIRTCTTQTTAGGWWERPFKHKWLLQSREKQMSDVCEFPLWVLTAVCARTLLRRRKGCTTGSKHAGASSTVLWGPIAIHFSHLSAPGNKRNAEVSDSFFRMGGQAEETEGVIWDHLRKL